MAGGSEIYELDLLGGVNSNGQSEQLILFADSFANEHSPLLSKKFKQKYYNEETISSDEDNCKNNNAVATTQPQQICTPS